jgi:hypothetical protein
MALSLFLDPRLLLFCHKLEKTGMDGPHTRILWFTVPRAMSTHPSQHLLLDSREGL